MAKTKVFELAKELGIHSKDVITFLQGKGVEAKAAQSSIEDDATAMVKKHFGKSEGEKTRSGRSIHEDDGRYAGKENREYAE